MKWFGLLLVILAGTGMGLCASRRLSGRVGWFTETQQLFREMLLRMRVTALPLADIWRELAEQTAFESCRLAQLTVSRTASGCSFEEAFQCAAETVATELALSEEDRRVLAMFAERCGKTDFEGQRELVDSCCAQLQIRFEEESALAKTRVALYRTLGVSGGIALALLLL